MFLKTHMLLPIVWVLFTNPREEPERGLESCAWKQVASALSPAPWLCFLEGLARLFLCLPYSSWLMCSCTVLKGKKYSEIEKAREREREHTQVHKTSPRWTLWTTGQKDDSFRPALISYIFSFTPQGPEGKGNWGKERGWRPCARGSPFARSWGQWMGCHTYPAWLLSFLGPPALSLTPLPCSHHLLSFSLCLLIFRCLSLHNCPHTFVAQKPRKQVDRIELCWQGQEEKPTERAWFPGSRMRAHVCACACACACVCVCVWDVTEKLRTFPEGLWEGSISAHLFW
jgi:hypothetical protein